MGFLTHLTEFYNYVGFPSTIHHDNASGNIVEVSPVPLPVRIPPTPTPPPPLDLVNVAMAEDDDPRCHDLPPFFSSFSPFPLWQQPVRNQQ